MLTIAIRAGIGITLAVGLAGSVSRPAERSPEGTWEGGYETSESGGELTIRVMAGEERWAVHVRATSAYAADGGGPLVGDVDDDASRGGRFAVMRASSRRSRGGSG